MSLEPDASRRSISPTSSGRSTPLPRTSRRVVEEGLYKADKSLRRYATTVERALATWEVSPEEWADYIAFLGRLLKAIQSHPKDVPLLPHSSAVASKLAQCLNPALPSGVHQKAIEVYAYIFDTFQQGFISNHLHEFLPGLGSVLSFASLSVRPGLYSIYEERITKLQPEDLRPVLKSLILSLLPALEDETSEDFERAFRIMELLEQNYSRSHHVQIPATERDGYFWQCLFLAVITSPSRRQGALNFLLQKLPKFASTSQNAISTNGEGHSQTTAGLSAEAEAVISPEPGLLIRCFACGLSDSQALIQRGYLDLLVSNLPLDSPLLQSRIRLEDLDRLVSSAAQVLLRREMSLNRRLWSWFLGPDPKANGTEGAQAASPTLDRSNPGHATATNQLKYFSLYGRKPLERSILAQFKRGAKVPAKRAQPFRICLSLMDRWEIGGSIIPQIFVPAIESAYQYSLSAPPEDTAEVIRSASLFFDGIEATLIWEKLLELLRDGQTHKSTFDGAHMFEWIVHHFNINDEEMLSIHVPYALTYGLALLSDDLLHDRSDTNSDFLFDLMSYLLSLIPERAFPKPTASSSKTGLSSSAIPVTTDVMGKIESLYQTGSDPESKTHNLFGMSTWTEICYQLLLSIMLQPPESRSEHIFVRATWLLISLHTKAPSATSHAVQEYLPVVMQKLRKMTKPRQVLSFPAIQSIVALMPAFAAARVSTYAVSEPDMVDLIPAVAAQAWQYLSPISPKYNVEAAKSIWQLHDLSASNEILEASLMLIIRDGLNKRVSSNSQRTETCRRFAVLWNHTVPTPSGPRRGSQGFSRKGSTMPVASDVTQAFNRQKVLNGPLMLLLDEFRWSSDSTHDVVRSWLQNLNSLEQVFRVHFEDLTRLSIAADGSGSTERNFDSRERVEITRHMEYVVSHIVDILKLANDWIWSTLQGLPMANIVQGDDSTAAEVLAKFCVRFIRHSESLSIQLQTSCFEMLDILLSGPVATALKTLDLDSSLVDQLMDALSTNTGEFQASLLKLIIKALKLRLEHDEAEMEHSAEERNSFKSKRPHTSAVQQSSNSSSSSLAVTPPSQLLKCLKLGFSSPAARSHLDQWLAFLSNVLPVYADAIFTSLIPLVECLCAELERTHSTLVSMSQIGETLQAYTPEAVVLALLDALELVLARAHECLELEQAAEQAPKPSAPSRGILSNMTSGVFKSEALPTRTAQANSRLTVILTFQDTIRVSTKLWTWAGHSSETADFDKASAATTSYNALKLRNRARYLLEQMFDSEPLESLEVLISNWCFAMTPTQASATLDLVHVMQGMRPKKVVPTILDSICSRTNPSALPSQRQSSQTIDLSAVDVNTFLYAYIESIEDDAMDEIWSDCLAFMRDVLSNPLPHRQILPSLLLTVMLLAQKIDNTNFGEQRKMRRDLGDIFLRLLGATFTTMPSGYTLEPAAEHEQAMTGTDKSTLGRKSHSLAAVLVEVIMNLEVILETSDRVLNAINSISNNLISPMIHAKSFPGNINSETLSLYLQIAKRAPPAKQWKKDLADAFNDHRLLTVPIHQMENAWFPLLSHWCLYDKERMPELLSRLSAPSSAGIMFGVGASAARLEADRKTQLNLRRISLLLICAPEEAFAIHLRPMEEKLVELFEASASSSPSSSIKAELFMLCRAVVLSTSAVHLAPFWPIINDNLQNALSSLLPGGPTSASLGNLSLLQACKLLDLLVALAPEEFQLHEWLYITDTIDAVYQPVSWTPSALSDCVAEGLAASLPEAGNSMIPPTPVTGTTSSKRRPLISNSSLTDMEDIKASTRDDFAHAVVRPFLSQLSLQAYEGVYSMESPDVGVCRNGLLEDLLDLRTIVE